MKVSRRAFLQGTSAIAASVVLPKWANAAPQFTYKLGLNLIATHPSSIRCKEAAARILEETGGRLQINVFPASALGTDTDCLSQLRSGALEMFHLSPVILATLLPIASISGMGFAFSNYKDVWAAMDGDLGKFVREQIAKVNILAFDKIFDNGFRVITSSVRPITTPNDLKDFKMRVPPSPLWTTLFKALGSAPTTINWAEVYSALQTKVVDGQENPINLIAVSHIYEVQKYVSVTNHMWDGFWLLNNARSFKALPSDVQDIVRKNFDQAAVEQRADIAALDTHAAEDLKAKGMIFNTPDAAPFRDILKTSGWYADWKKRMGDDAWKHLEQYSGALG